MYICNVKSCKKSKDIKGVKLHGFPKDPDLFAKWCETTRIKIPFEKRQYYHICSLHFDPDCFFPINRNRTNLKVGSIPTLLLNESDTSNRKDPPPTALDEKNGQLVNLDDLLQNNDLINKEKDLDILVRELQPNEMIVSSFDNNSVKTEEIEIEKPYFKALRSISVGSNLVHEVCRLCFRLLKEEEIIKLYEETTVQDINELKIMLQQVLPDLDFTLYPNIVICKNCTKLLAYSHQLRKTWSTTEEKIRKIAEEKKKVTNSESDLIIITRSKVGEELTEYAQEEILKTVNIDHNYGKTNVSTSTNINQALIRKRNYYLMKQELRAWGKGPYLCEKCGFVSKYLNSIRQHVERHNNCLTGIKGNKRNIIKKLKTIKCNICKQFFSSERHLRMHVEKHRRKHRCLVCDKEFTTNSSLNTHLSIIHLRSFNYHQCHLCGKQFTYRTSLNVHLKSHNPAQVGKCHICNRKYQTKYQLRRHLWKVHSGNSPLTCQYCGKSIKYRHTLEKHIRVFHLKLGDTICNICDKPFFKKSSLIQHKIRVHGCYEN